MNFFFNPFKQYVIKIKVINGKAVIIKNSITALISCEPFYKSGVSCQRCLIAFNENLIAFFFVYSAGQLFSFHSQHVSHSKRFIETLISSTLNNVFLMVSFIFLKQQSKSQRLFSFNFVFLFFYYYFKKIRYNIC